MRTAVPPGRPWGAKLRARPRSARSLPGSAEGAAPRGGAARATPSESELDTHLYRRTVYNQDLWVKHRNPNRYMYNIESVPSSRIIRKLWQPMGAALAWAALFGFYQDGLASGLLPPSWPSGTLTDSVPHELPSFALSLLLLYRITSSYVRFDEANKLWAGLLARARSLTNQAVNSIPPKDVASREAVGKWTVGFCLALQAHLQEDADLRAHLGSAQPPWSQREIEILCSAQHRPLKAISMLSELSRQLPLSGVQALCMQQDITLLYHTLGHCERLLDTPLPKWYTRHTSRFLVLWLALLPLELWGLYDWYMMPMIGMISFLMLGIDEVGVSIEEPFSIMPLDSICARAQADVVGILQDDADTVSYVAAVLRRAPTDPPPQKPAVPDAPPASVAAAAAAAAAADPWPGPVGGVPSAQRSGR